jgi:DNA-binding MarR family transcriptional regulator
VGRKPRRDAGLIRWTGNARVILMQLWISAEPEHLISRIVTALDIPQPTVSHHLRMLERDGYVTRRRGGAVRQFAAQFNGGDNSTHGTLSRADLWSITEAGKAKAEALAAEKEEE